MNRDVKEPVKLRAKTLKNGSQSLYLDIYSDRRRQYEFLKLYLIPEVDDAAREQNANTLRAARAIKARRVLELTDAAAGITSAARVRIPLADFVKAYQQRKERAGQLSTARHAGYLWRWLRKWRMDGGTLAGIDRAYCRRLADKLRAAPLAPATQGIYFQLFNTMLNDAVRGGLLAVNPARQLDASERPKKTSPEREYLTAEEVRRLAAAPMRSKPSLCAGWEIVKRAFMFSCFCGLRVSDLRALRWGDISQVEGHAELRITMQKTRRELVVPLSAAAVGWLPQRPTYATDDARVFRRLNCYANLMLKEWAAMAGIKKRISFHTARHTFATMLITSGADVYTVSKLLGHHSVTVTQIYAKVVDSRKVEAVNLLNAITLPDGHGDNK